MSHIRASADVFRAIADPTRRHVLEQLYWGERRASDLSGPGEISRPAMSWHLRTLQEAGLVAAKVTGRNRVYRFNPRSLEEVQRWVMRLMADPRGHAWWLAETIGAERKSRP